jgi:hypothetical protein
MKPRGRKKPKLKIRIPTPKPTRFHSTPKGKKGYDRKRAKEEYGFLKNPEDRGEDLNPLILPPMGGD